jgi:hypothetical protein
MSPGSMSGVHCTREAVAFIDCPMARASIDLPVPGRSSKRMWPSHMIATRASLTTSFLPLMTVSMFSTMRSKWSLKCSAPLTWRLERERGARPRVVAISGPSGGVRVGERDAAVSHHILHVRAKSCDPS